MGEEQKRILEMVAAKDISVEDAQRLLDALGEGAEPTPEPGVRRVVVDDGELLDDLFDEHAHATRRYRVRTRSGPRRSVDEILSLAALGIKPDFVKAMRGLFDEVTADELLSLRAVDIDAGYVRAMQDVLEDVDIDGLVSLKATGVTAEYVRELVDAGIEGLHLDDLLSRHSTDE